MQYVHWIMPISKCTPEIFSERDQTKICKFSFCTNNTKMVITITTSLTFIYEENHNIKSESILKQKYIT